MGHPSPRGRLLIVDDDYSVCAMLVEKFANEGYDCDSCSGGELALDLLRHHVYDALVVDLMMPGITGLEVLAIAKKSHPRTAFIVITGMHDIQLAERALSQGADAYHVKPIHLRELAASLTQAIERKRHYGESTD